MTGSWSTSNRRQTLPPNWPQLRRECLRRDDYKCQWPTGAGICGAYANQCDHVIPSGPDTLDNLRALCHGHHKVKSSSEGGRALGQIRKQIAAAKRRPAEPHPGLKPSA